MEEYGADPLQCGLFLAPFSLQVLKELHICMQEDSLLASVLGRYQLLGASLLVTS